MTTTTSRQRTLFDDDPAPVRRNPTPPHEAFARDAMLALLERHRGDIIEAAHRVALAIVASTGRVTSVEVLAELRRDPVLRERVERLDRRFMGPVFRRPGWRRIGYESTGSHGRPVAIWARA